MRNGGALYLESRDEPLCNEWHAWARRHQARICRCISFETASQLLLRDRPIIVICRGILSVGSCRSGARYLEALLATVKDVSTQLVIVSSRRPAAMGDDDDDALVRAVRGAAPYFLTLAVSDDASLDGGAAVNFASRCLEEARSTGHVVETVREAQCDPRGIEFTNLCQEHHANLSEAEGNCLLLPFRYYLQRRRQTSEQSAGVTHETVGSPRKGTC